MCFLHGFPIFNCSNNNKLCFLLGAAGWELLTGKQLGSACPLNVHKDGINFPMDESI